MHGKKSQIFAKKNVAQLISSFGILKLNFCWMETTWSRMPYGCQIEFVQPPEWSEKLNSNCWKSRGTCQPQCPIDK